jgi:hypothetical protein
MEHHGELLAEKLAIILQTAMTHKEENLTSRELAQIVAEAEHIEFGYRYRADTGKIEQGYTSEGTIRHQYISFLEFIGLLDQELRPTLSFEVLWDPDRMQRTLADRAKDKLAEVDTGVQKVADVAVRLLTNSQGDLPTVDAVYEALDANLAEWRFKWLMNLYTAGSTSLVCRRWSPLLLPRKYAKPK